MKFLMRTLRGNLGVMTLSSGLWNFAGQMVWPFHSLYILSLGASYFDLGILSGLWSISRIVSLLLGGYLSDKLGRKKLVVSLSFILSLLNLPFALAPSWFFLIPVVLVDGFVSGLREPAFLAIIADSVPNRFRAFGFAIWDFGPAIFGLLSPYIAGLMIKRLGLVKFMRFGYLLVFFFSLIASFLRLLFLRETLEVKTSSIKLGKLVIESLRSIKLFPFRVKLLLLASALASFIYGSAEPFFVVYAVKDFSIVTELEWGLITTFQIAFRLLFTPIIAYLSDRVGRANVMVVAPMFVAFSLLLFPYASSAQNLMIVMLLYSTSSSVFSIVASALITDIIPQDFRGRAVAIKSFIGEFSMVSGSFLAGYGYQMLSPLMPFIASSAVMMIISAIVFISLFYVRGN